MDADGRGDGAPWRGGGGGGPPGHGDQRTTPPPRCTYTLSYAYIIAINQLT
jgi:hypothetical protein